MDRATFLAGVASALGVAEKVGTMLSAGGVPFAGAIATGIKIATGVAAEIPEAVALYDQFNTGTIPSQAELDAYAAAEDGAYSKLMADLNAAS